MARFIKISLVLVVIYAVVGFFVVPPLAKKELEKRLEIELGRNVTIGGVRMNPFALSTTLENFEVSTVDGSGRWVGWTKLYVNVDPLKSLSGDWVVGQIALSGFNADVEISEDGRLNFADLIEKFGARKEEPKEPSMWDRPVRIGRLDVAGAQVAFTDRSKGDGEPFTSTLGPLNFRLLNFRTAGAGGAYRFEATSEAGETLDWTGTLSADPLASSGDWRIEKVQLAKYGPYLAEHVNAHIAAGELTTSGRYEASFAPGQARMIVADGAVQLRHLQVLERKGGPTVLELDAIEIAGMSADAIARRVAVDTVRLGNGRALLRRNEDGTLNVQALLKESSEPGGETRAAAPAAPAIGATVKEISVRDFAVELEDRAVETPVQLKLARIEADVKAFTLEPGAEIPIALNFALEPQGSVRIGGNVTLDPLHGALDLDLQDVPLAPGGAYVREFAEAGVARGTLTMKGQANVTQAEGGAFTGTFTGEAAVKDFAVTGADGQREIAGLTEFSLKDIKAAATPEIALTVGEVMLDRPFARAVRDEKGELNFAAIMKSRPEGEESAPPRDAPAGETSPAASRPEIAIARVTVRDGDFTLSDLSVQPNVNLSLAQVNGAVRNLSSQRPELGDADVQARVNGSAPVRILGRVNPLVAQPFADLRVDLESLDLVPASPYFGKYVGFELRSGRLFVETRAKLANEELDMNNSITVEQFNLGAETNSPDALKLPVRLGVALLKDAQGKIALDVPVQGSLADPKFEVGKVVGQVFSNLLTRAATSPFAFIGSMFGGGGEELGEQIFVPGTVEFAGDSLRRLEVVRRALVERPALVLAVEGGADPAADAEAVKRRKLDALLRDAMGAVEAQGVDAGAREAALRTLFEQRFPSGVGGSLAGATAGERSDASAMAAQQVTPQPATTARAEPGSARAEDNRGLLKRTWDLATLKGARDWWNARHERRDAEERAESERRAADERARVAAAAAAQPSGIDATMAQPVLSVEEMERHLLASVPVEPSDLAELARARAERVRETLLAGGGVEPERVEIAESPGGEPKVQGARARLQLR